MAGCTGLLPGSGNDNATDGSSPTAQSGGTGGNNATTAATTAATDQPTTTHATTSVGESTTGEPTTASETTTAGETTTAPTAIEQPTATATQTATAQPTTTATATATPGAGGSSALFTAGEYYRLASGTEWRVVSFENGKLIVETTDGGLKTKTTVQVDSPEFFQFLVTSPFADLYSFANTVVSLAQTRSLTVGSQWTVTPDEFGEMKTRPGGAFFLFEKTATFTITGTDTVAGVSCKKIESTVDGRPWKTGCVNEELAFALSYTGYNLETGQVRDTATVVEYQSGEGQ